MKHIRILFFLNIIFTGLLSFSQALNCIACGIGQLTASGLPRDTQCRRPIYCQHCRDFTSTCHQDVQEQFYTCSAPHCQGAFIQDCGENHQPLECGSCYSSHSSGQASPARSSSDGSASNASPARSSSSDSSASSDASTYYSASSSAHSSPGRSASSSAHSSPGQSESDSE